jgi:hypothetical protein
MRSVRFFTQNSKPVSYGSFDEIGSLNLRDSTRMFEEKDSDSKDYSAEVADMLFKIKNMISALSAEPSFLNGFCWAVYNRELFLELVATYENETCSYNNWPFDLDEAGLKEFLLSINFDIRTYVTPKMRESLRNDLKLLMCNISQTYLFTPDECEVIQEYQSTQDYQELGIEMIKLMTELREGDVDNLRLEIFAAKINKLALYIRNHFGQFSPVIFDHTSVFHSKILTKRLVVLGLQLKPFLEIGMHDKTLLAKLNLKDTAVPVLAKGEDAVVDMDELPNRCPMM